MPSARLECPECHSQNVFDLRNFLRSPRYDYFRCRECNCWWMLPSGEAQPATRIILGTSTSSAAADIARPLPKRSHPCPKCNGRSDLLSELSVFSPLDYYRCTSCLHVWIYETGAPDSPAVDVTIRSDHKAS